MVPECWLHSAGVGWKGGLQGGTSGSRVPGQQACPPSHRPRAPCPTSCSLAWRLRACAEGWDGRQMCCSRSVGGGVPSLAAENGKEPGVRDSPAAPRQSPAALPTITGRAERAGGCGRRGFHLQKDGQPPVGWRGAGRAGSVSPGAWLLPLSMIHGKQHQLAEAGTDPRPGRGMAQRGPGHMGGSVLAAIPVIALGGQSSPRKKVPTEGRWEHTSRGWEEAGLEDFKNPSLEPCWPMGASTLKGLGGGSEAKVRSLGWAEGQGGLREVEEGSIGLVQTPRGQGRGRGHRVPEPEKLGTQGPGIGQRSGHRVLGSGRDGGHRVLGSGLCFRTLGQGSEVLGAGVGQGSNDWPPSVSFSS
nr:uncharacterized protein LOC120368452 [Saimiri boliviensis boliviensis]